MITKAAPSICMVGSRSASSVASSGHRSVVCESVRRSKGQEGEDVVNGQTMGEDEVMAGTRISL